MRQFTLVLGGGGLRGLAHIGVIRALEEHRLDPREVVGSSVGSLVAAAWCGGMSVREMEQFALQLRRRDLFQIAHADMALKRTRSPAVYRSEPLVHFVRGVLGDTTFAELERPLLVNTVDINRGTQVFWGLPGLQDIPVADAVIASCALPGFLAPHEIDGHFYVDGAAAANLPVQTMRVADRDLIIAVDVSARGREGLNVQRDGFIAVYGRAIELGMHRNDEATLQRWSRPPLLMIRPRVWHIDLLSFQHNRELIDAGYQAAHAVLDRPEGLPAVDAVGVFPRTRVRVTVDRPRCIGCGVCVYCGSRSSFRLDDQGKAVPTDPTPLWSPVDGLCVKQCPTHAIKVERVERRADA